MKKIAISLVILVIIPFSVGVILFTVFEKTEREFFSSTHKQTMMNNINSSSDIHNVKLIAIHAELSEERWQIIALNDLKRYSYILFLISLVNMAVCIYIFSVTQNIFDNSSGKETSDNNIT